MQLYTRIYSSFKVFFIEFIAQYNKADAPINDWCLYKEISSQHPAYQHDSTSYTYNNRVAAVEPEQSFGLIRPVLMYPITPAGAV